MDVPSSAAANPVDLDNSAATAAGLTMPQNDKYAASTRAQAMMKL